MIWWLLLKWQRHDFFTFSFLSIWVPFSAFFVFVFFHVILCILLCTCYKVLFRLTYKLWFFIICISIPFRSLLLFKWSLWPNFLAYRHISKQNGGSMWQKKLEKICFLNIFVFVEFRDTLKKGQNGPKVDILVTEISIFGM